MHATTKPLFASSPAPPAKWASRLSTDQGTTLSGRELVNEFDTAQFEALGPWITGFEFGGNHYGGQYRADTDLRVLRFVSTFRERLAASNRSRGQPFGPAVLLKAEKTSTTSGQLLEAFLQRDIPGASLDIGRALVVAVFSGGGYEWRCEVEDVIYPKGDCCATQPPSPTACAVFRGRYRHHVFVLTLRRL